MPQGLVGGRTGSRWRALRSSLPPYRQRFSPGPDLSRATLTSAPRGPTPGSVSTPAEPHGQPCRILVERTPMSEPRPYPPPASLPGVSHPLACP